MSHHGGSDAPSGQTLAPAHAAAAALETHLLSCCLTAECVLSAWGLHLEAEPEQLGATSQRRQRVISLHSTTCHMTRCDRCNLKLLTLKFNQRRLHKGPLPWPARTQWSQCWVTCNDKGRLCADALLTTTCTGTSLCLSSRMFS